jgi:MFS family permease
MSLPPSHRLRTCANRLQVYGYLYLLLTTFPRVFGSQYDFSEKSIALVYLGVGVGSLLGLVFTAAISDRLLNHLAKRYNNGKPKPEYRLPTMLVGSILVPISLFLYGWSAENKVHWIAPVIGTAILGAAMMIVFVRIRLEYNTQFQRHWMLTRVRRCRVLRT